jgi:hypothetical protein
MKRPPSASQSMRREVRCAGCLARSCDRHPKASVG